MSILFINGGEKGGNTSALGQRFLTGHDFDQIDLADHKVYDHGQHFNDDEFDQVLARFKQADTIVLGSPVYWHDLSGMTRNLLDRFYGPVAGGSMAGKRLFFIFQGSAPTPAMLERAESTVSRFAGLYGMEYMGMATDAREAADLASKIAK